jgi:putative cell wall-binding protein
VGGASGFRERKTCKVRSEQVCSGIGGAVQDCAFGLSHLATTTSLMEARVTTATRRLRRTGAAGLVAAVTAGVTLLATATSAFAALGVVTNQIDGTTGATTVYPGTTAVAVGSYDLNLTNHFNIGDTITVSLSQAPGCGTTGGAVGFSAVPTVTASGPFTNTFDNPVASVTDASFVTPTFTVVTQSSVGACTTAGVKDQALITFTNSSAGTGADNIELVVGGQKVNVGSAVTPYSVTETSAVSSGTAPGAGVVVATVANTKASITETSAGPGTTAGIALSPLTLSEVTAGAFLPAGAATTVTLLLAGASGTPQFTAAVTPTITVPTGYTVTPAATTASNTYTFTVTAPATAVAATVVVSGLTVNLTAATAGIITLNAATPGVAHIGGSVLTVISVLTQVRTGGTDRYATAALLFSQGGFTGGANHVAVLASGVNYPDALSANYLAAGLNGGAGTRVLLTDPNVLPQPTYQALITGIANAITTVYIVGGTAAVSTNVSNAISAIHVGNNNANAFINVIRVAGADRYATNNQVDLFNGASAVHTAIVAVGSNFADALAISPVVVTQKFPLVLTNGPSLSASAQSTLVNLGITKVIIVGGTAAVSAATEASIKALGITIGYRIAGADRTLTASMIASYETTGTGTAAFAATTAYAALNGLGLNIAQVYVARGDGFADALAAGTVAGGVGTGSAVGAILLTGDPNTLGAGIPAYLATKHGVVTSLTTLGLTSAITVATANAAVASIT